MSTPAETINVPEKVTQLLETLGSKVGQGVEYLWPRAIEYVWAEALTMCIAGILFILLAILGARVSLKLLREDYDSAFGLFIAVVVLGLVVAGPVALFSYLPAVFAPEGSLIMKVLK